MQVITRVSTTWQPEEEIAHVFCWRCRMHVMSLSAAVSVASRSQASMRLYHPTPGNLCKQRSRVSASVSGPGAPGYKAPATITWLPFSSPEHHRAARSHNWMQCCGDRPPLDLHWQLKSPAWWLRYHTR